MKKNKFYECSLTKDKELYNGTVFDSFEEAKAAGLACIKEYNDNLNNPGYVPNDEVFEELESLTTTRRINR